MGLLVAVDCPRYVLRTRWEVNLVNQVLSKGKVAWVRLDNDAVRLTVIPEIGTQVWASLSIDTIFEDYTIQSAAPNNTINLELPLQPLNRALKSTLHASSASIRLTKKNGIPILSLTIVTHIVSIGNPPPNGFISEANLDNFGDHIFQEETLDGVSGRDRETVVTQDIPVRVLTAESVEGIHEPRVREPDAHIMLPSLIQLKAISDRFTKLAMATSIGVTRGTTSLIGPKLELAANMHGSLKLSITTDVLSISSIWTGLTNPILDPRQVEDGEESLKDHPSTKLRKAGPDAWSTVRIDGRDWGRVLSVGRLGGRVIACFANEHALILYVYLSNYEGTDESVLTTLAITATISLTLYLTLTFFILPIWKRYHRRYNSYLPLGRISSQTYSTQERINRIISNYLTPSSWRSQFLQSRNLNNPDEESDFDEDDGEELYEVDSNRREALSLDARRDHNEVAIRLSRDLEEGFRDDSDDSDDSGSGINTH